MPPLGWRHLDRPEWGPMNRISAMISAQKWTGGPHAPDFGGSERLILGCDFAGDPKRTRYRVITLILVDARSLGLWEELRLRLRGKYFNDRRRMAFKSLGERRRARALVPFLRAANSLSGAVLTVLIDQRISTVFRADPPATVEPNTNTLAAEVSRIDAASRERLFVLAHLVGLLLNGLSKPGQDVLFISDEDSVFANESRHRLASEVIGTVASHYLPHSVGRLQVATTRSDTGRLDLEDFVAIADLCAGAAVEAAGLRNRQGGFPVGVVAPVDRSLSVKSRAILAWLAEYWHPLRRWTIQIDHIPPDMLLTRWVSMHPEGPIPEYNWAGEGSLCPIDDPPK